MEIEKAELDNSHSKENVILRREGRKGKRKIIGAKE